MKNTHLSILAVLTFTGLTLTSGCAGKIEDLSGTYEGDYSRIENGVTRSWHVTTTIGAANWREGEFEVTIVDADTNKDLGQISVTSKWGKHYLSSPILAGEQTIEIEDRGTCGEQVEPTLDQAPKTYFCAQADAISFFSTDGTGKYRALLYLSKNSAQKVDPLVPDGMFDLHQLMRRAMENNYETRIASEKLIQAHQEVKLVRSRLFPSIGLMSAYAIFRIPGILSAASSGLAQTQANNLLLQNYLSYTQNAIGGGGVSSAALYQNLAFSMVGSLVPFIFPTHWFDLSRQNSMYEAEVMSYKNLVANQMSAVADIYFEILRDQKVLELTQQAQNSLEERRVMVKLKVDLGYAPRTDLNEIDTLIGRNLNDINRLSSELVRQYAILSRGIGMSPRHGVQGLLPIEPIAESDLIPLDSEKMMAEAKSSSQEILQALYLERAAKIQSNGTYFSFINPSSIISISEGIVHQVKIGKSRLREAGILRELTEMKVEEQVISIASMYNQLLERRQNVLPMLEIVNQQLKEAETLFINGSLSLLDYQIILASAFQIQMEKITVDSELAAAVSKRDRLLWRNPFAKAMTVDIPRSTF